MVLGLASQLNKMHSTDECGFSERPGSKALDLTLCHRVEGFQLPGPKVWNDKLSRPVHSAEEKTAARPEKVKKKKAFSVESFSLERISFSKESMNGTSGDTP